MQEAYQKAFLAVPPEVLGRQLLPFSLGHSLLLDIFESPFSRGGEITGEELIFAVWICTRPFRDALDQLQRQTMVKECIRWGRKCRKLDLNVAAQRFDDYVSESSVTPKRWEKPGAGGSARVPWQIAMFWNLCGSSVNEDLWDLPLGRVITYNAARLAQMGDESLMSEEELAVVESSEVSEVSDGES